MFGAAIGVVAVFFLIDRAQDVRLPTFETAAAPLGPNELI
jgi:hypothetical protein